MGAPKKKFLEKSKFCPICKEEMNSLNIRVQAKGWKAHYVCSKGHSTPTASLRR